ncbi:unnamed protein product [Rotaria socialis]
MKVVRGGSVSDGSCGEEGIKQGREEAKWLEGGEGDVIGDHYKIFLKSKQDEYIRIIKEEIAQSQRTIAILSCDPDASIDYIDWAKHKIETIHEQLNELEQIQLKIFPLKIDNSLINIESLIYDLKVDSSPPLLKDLFSSSSSKNELTSDLNSFSPLNSNKIDLENNSLVYYESAKQYLKVQSDNWYSLASNETNLLISEKSNLSLIDQSLRIINRKSFLNIGIKDLCWSKILSRFILITPKEIYTLDENMISLELCPINIINNYRWERGTSSNKTLFISTFGENPLIVEYNLLPSIHLNKRWQSAISFQENDIINDIKSNETYIGLIIENDTINQSYFQIRLIKSFQLIYSVDLGKGWAYRCSNINGIHWIIVDSYNHRLIQILNNGETNKKIYNYSTKPFNITHWTQQQFVIRTTEHIYIHDYC